jgi:hypothetical protein
MAARRMRRAVPSRTVRLRFPYVASRFELLPSDASRVRTQMDWLLRGAGNPGRRTCSDCAEAKAWLGLRLDATERAALDRFLALLALKSSLTG